MAIFRKRERKELHFDIAIYRILIDGLCESGRHSTAIQLFSSLSERNLQPNLKTYSVMPKGLCKAGLLVEAIELFERMEENGCWPNDAFHSIIIQEFLHNSDIAKAMHYVDIMISKGFSAGVSTAYKLVNLMCDDKLDESMKELIQRSILQDKATEIK
ncbi:hypothetical protein Ancab_024059 [Ancistrocladus abbreviatus]